MHDPFPAAARRSRASSAAGTPSPRASSSTSAGDADPEHACLGRRVVAVGAPAAGAVGCGATVLDNCYFRTEAHVLTDGGRAAPGGCCRTVSAFLGAAFAIPRRSSAGST